MIVKSIQHYLYLKHERMCKFYFHIIILVYISLFFLCEIFLEFNKDSFHEKYVLNIFGTGIMKI